MRSGIHEHSAFIAEELPLPNIDAVIILLRKASLHIKIAIHGAEIFKKIFAQSDYIRIIFISIKTGNFCILRNIYTQVILETALLVLNVRISYGGISVLTVLS